jgi:hypothetical protein
MEVERISKENLYKIGNKLGLLKKDVKDILNSNGNGRERAYFSMGPSWYPGTKYGTISIKEF